MSNHLAIAAATSTLRYVLDRALQPVRLGPVGYAQVTTLRPDRLNTPDLVQSAGINVFLYLVTPNPAWNLAALPTRDQDAAFLKRPLCALDLHYLITCYGKDAALEGQRLLGRAVTALSVTPVLSPEVVAAALREYSHVEDTAFLPESDLAAQIEPVRLSPATLSLDDLSKLWSVFPQTPYQLSVTYTATVALLESPAVPRAALPVRERAFTISTTAAPRLVSAETGAAGAGTRLDLRGEHLLGRTTQVRLGPVGLEPLPGATPSLLTAAVDAKVPAGLHAVQVLHLSSPGAHGLPPARVVATSNALPVTVRPTVTRVTVGDSAIVLDLSPPLFAGQRATVSLSRAVPDSGAEPGKVDFVLPTLAAETLPQPSVRVPRQDVPDGAWLVRLQVDGIDSLPDLVGGTYGSPTVTLPPP
ncbi:DUF4255 domain-containing protein [Streptomyces sp. NPDC058622]|uniref:DUF4255 domain-containing protein n=1 Tax=Streptomyces sp. NPDC058622 TaxID=3346562 RepID=UPI003668BEDB